MAGPSLPAAPPPGRAALVVGIGGAVGSLARASVGAGLSHEPGTWAWATFAVNTTGCLALALLLVVLTDRRPRSHYPRLLLGTGLLGGYTTFSTFSVDTVRLLDAGRSAAAGAYVVASLLAMLAATAVGLLLGRALVRGRVTPWR